MHLYPTTTTTKKKPPYFTWFISHLFLSHGIIKKKVSNNHSAKANSEYCLSALLKNIILYLIYSHLSMVFAGQHGKRKHPYTKVNSSTKFRKWIAKITCPKRPYALPT